MHQFEYNTSVSYENNFTKWRLMNSKERRDFRLPEYTLDEAQELFYDIYGKKQKTSFRG